MRWIQGHCHPHRRLGGETSLIPGVAKPYPASLEPAVVPRLEVYEDVGHHKAIESVFLLQGKPFAHGSASLGSCGFAEIEVDRNVARLSLLSRGKPPPVVLAAAFPGGRMPVFLSA
jgi:hypothetical protein